MIERWLKPDDLIAYTAYCRRVTGTLRPDR